MRTAAHFRTSEKRNLIFIKTQSDCGETSVRDICVVTMVTE